MTAILLIILTSSIYRVIHPYVDKDLPNDRNFIWGFSLCLLMLIIVSQSISMYFFSFNLIDFFTRTNY